MEIRVTEVFALIDKLEQYKTKQQILADEEKIAHRNYEELDRLETLLRHKEFRDIAAQKVRNSFFSYIYRLVCGQQTFSALRRQVKNENERIWYYYKHGGFKSKTPRSKRTYFFNRYVERDNLWTIDRYIDKLKLASRFGDGLDVVVMSNDDVKFLVGCQKKFD